MYVCELCGHEACSVAARANHVRWKHKRADSQVKCDCCGLTFEAPNFSAHAAVCGTKSHQCEAGCGTLTENDRFCSKRCSAIVNNTVGKTGYVRYRTNNGITRVQTYRDVCFKEWPEACAICGWSIAIDVHHIDGKHSNDNVRNLIPLCQNHHMMTRMREHSRSMRTQLEALVEQRLGMRYVKEVTLPYASGEAA